MWGNSHEIRRKMRMLMLNTIKRAWHNNNKPIKHRERMYFFSLWVGCESRRTILRIHNGANRIGIILTNDEITRTSLRTQLLLEQKNIQSFIPNLPNLRISVCAVLHSPICTISYHQYVQSFISNQPILIPQICQDTKLWNTDACGCERLVFDLDA